MYQASTPSQNTELNVGREKMYFLWNLLTKKKFHQKENLTLSLSVIVRYLIFPSISSNINLLSNHCCLKVIWTLQTFHKVLVVNINIVKPELHLDVVNLLKAPHVEAAGDDCRTGVWTIAGALGERRVEIKLFRFAEMWRKYSREYFKGYALNSMENLCEEIYNLEDLTDRSDIFSHR